MRARPLLVLAAADVAALLDPCACLGAVEAAFRRLGEGSVPAPALCGLHASGGGFHVKAALMPAEPPGPRASRASWFAAKVNANFPANPELRGLPTVQGAVLLFDGECGVPLAILESGTLTALRTAAATAVAARWLAPPGARVAALVGCGVQGRAHLAFLRAVLPSLERVRLYDPDERAVSRAAAAAMELGLVPERAADPAAACREGDVCVTCTPSRAAIVDLDDVRAGGFVAGVGADNESKHELAPALLAGATVVTDLLVQCERIGDLHHAITAGALTPDDVHADLGDVVAGRRPGRAADDEIVVFDSTGVAVQDVAVAALVYERALARGRGVSVELAS